MRLAGPRPARARRSGAAEPARPDPLPRDGMWLVDKSPGLSSRQSLDCVTRALDRRDLGHAGTLDPFATGLLLTLGGRATRLVPWVQEWEKEYEGLVRLGVATDSLDATGRVTATADVPPLEPTRLEQTAASFVGRIEQAAPMFSAAHSGGQRLYELARRGLEVEREPKERFIHAFELLAISGADVRIRVVCSSGTYIRVLAESFGAALGLPAHLAALARTRIGPWALADALPDGAFAGLDPTQRAARAIPLAEILADWPSVTLTAEEAAPVRQGRLLEPGAGARIPPGTRCRLRSPLGGLVALAERPSEGAPRLLRVFESGDPAAGEVR